MLGSSLFERVLRSRSERKFHARVPDDHVLDDEATTVGFVPDEAYFEIRLAEMYLRDKREYWVGYVPFGILISDFLYDGAIRTVPFFIGNRMLGEIEREIEGGRVEYLNTKVAGPIPYMGDDVGLFVGLFRAQVDNLAKGLFDLVDSVIGTFDVGQVGAYLSLAHSVTDRLADVLGIPAVQLRLGTREEFVAATFRSGYFAYANCPDSELDRRRLWVRDSRLLQGERADALRPLAEHDFCLVRIAHRTERDDYRKLPFYRLWHEAKRLVSHDKVEQSDALLPTLMEELAVSPDFTTADRFNLQLLFKSNYEAEVEHRARLRPGTRAPATVTRHSGGSMDARARLEKTAYVADRRGLSPEVPAALLDLKAHWREIPHLEERSEEFELTDLVLAEQLAAIKKVMKGKAVDPRAFAATIALDIQTPP
jgi:hypothetical protein